MLCKRRREEGVRIEGPEWVIGKVEPLPTTISEEEAKGEVEEKLLKSDDMWVLALVSMNHSP